MPSSLEPAAISSLKPTAIPSIPRRPRRHRGWYRPSAVSVLLCVPVIIIIVCQTCPASGRGSAHGNECLQSVDSIVACVVKIFKVEIEGIQDKSQAARILSLVIVLVHLLNVEKVVAIGKLGDAESDTVECFNVSAGIVCDKNDGHVSMPRIVVT